MKVKGGFKYSLDWNNKFEDVPFYLLNYFKGCLGHLYFLLVGVFITLLIVYLKFIGR